MKLGRGGRPRRLNRPLVKGVVMLSWSAFFGLWSGMTGIGSQVVTDPFCRFMLGWIPEKSTATTHLAAWVAGAVFLATWILCRGDLSVMPVLATTLGAFVGALLAGKLRLGPAGRRLACSALVLVSVWILGESVRHRFGGPLTLNVDQLKTPIGYGLAGLTAGFLSQVSALPIGALMVPMVVFACGGRFGVAVATTAATAVLAGGLTLFAYAATDRIDRPMAGWMTIGSASGACGAAILLASASSAASPIPLTLFAITSMLTGAWMAWRSTQ